MPLTIATKKESARFTNDYILKDVALASSGAVTSSAFQTGATKSQLQINIEATTALVAGAVIVVDYQTSATEGGSYASELKMTIPAGTYSNAEMLKFVPVNKGKEWGKLVITTAENLSASKVNAYITG